MDLGIGQVDVTGDDDALWERQRAGQRSDERALVQVAAPPSELPAVLRAVDACEGTLVGRAALGISYVEVEPEAVQKLRSALPMARRTTLLDAPPSLRSELDPWGPVEAPALELMRSVKARFDPTHTCNPGLFVGGI